MVWRLDRLGLVTDPQERGVQLRSLGESIDTDHGDRPADLARLRALAEFERGSLAESARAEAWTRRGPAAAAAARPAS